MIVAHMLLLNLFVGVIIDNFNVMKQELGGLLLLTEHQQEWVHMQRFMLRRNLK